MTSTVNDVNSYSNMFNTFMTTSLNQNKCLCLYLFDKYNDQECYITSNSDLDGRTCNMSCYTVLKRHYDMLNSCLDHATNELNNEELNKFDQKWSESFLNEYPQATDFYGFSIYHYCASNNNLKLFKCALRNYSKGIDLVDAKGMTVLMRACQKNHYKFVQFLLENTSVNVNGSELCMQTPLSTAIMNQSDQLVGLLLKHKANPSRMPYMNKNVTMSPLKCAIVYNRFEAMCLLLKYGANPLEELLIDDNYSSYTTLLRLFYKNFDGRHFKYMIILNDFIQNPNIYRLIFYSYFKTKTIELPHDTSIDTLFKQYVYRSSSIEHKTLECEFLGKLLDYFYKPKTLRELCRFKIRKFTNFNTSLVDCLQIPNVLKTYVKYE
jgi:ankyrin repeat protein